MPHLQLCHHIPCHHMCNATSSTMPYSSTMLYSSNMSYFSCHHYLSLSLSLSCHHIHWLFLCHSWTPLTSIKIITQMYQQSPPLALISSSKHSPPLITMTKDNLLCQCCTYFDIRFPISLIFDNSSYHHISPLTEFGYLTNVLSFILTFPFLQQVLGW